MKRRFLIILLIVTIVILILFSNNQGSGNITLSPDNIERTFTADDGNTYVVANGNYYRDYENGSYGFLKKYYDPDFFKKNHYVEDGITYRINPGNPTFQLRVNTEITDDFENYNTVQDLFITAADIEGNDYTVNDIQTFDVADMRTRWNVLTLQSKSTPTVSDYIKLRRSILDNGADFLDNRLEPSTERAHSGTRSVRMYSTAPTKKMVTSKSSFSSDTVHFTKGDDFWFSGWFYLEEGMPTTIMDLESTWLDEHSGIRIFLSETGYPAIELKAFEKPMWRNRQYTVPQNQWIKVVTHFELDEIEGEIEMWINDDKVIDTNGQTLPLANTVYDSFEIGISAAREETILFVDDVKVSASPLK